ncbi:hypothetical protein [Cupriavidus metallidurans]|jgi:hypothetical protein|uniref:Uncharacterized protein n=1 Tax=Cupriavidus metallidurans TaxID=119219 RepID=A0A482IR42_9BURK|nr:hypothetical protein [Cupriavidus metallidurans]QBP10093.1 hypothetical protein DDF84_010160 [Cupriavidus metallidurans]QWC87168.1 hypothetical protein KB891_08700 [Cupriavidus metallidurans]
MADVVAGQCRDSRYPEPLSAVQLRAMYRRNRTPEVRALLWEIARLQAIVRRADQLLACFPASAGTSTATALEIVLGALRRELVGEPCLEEELHRRAEEEWSAKLATQDPWAAKREARRRRNS